MVGAAGIVASTINNRHQRRESRSSQHGGVDEHLHGGRLGSRATISDGGRASSNANCYRDGPPSYTRSHGSNPNNQVPGQGAQQNNQNANQIQNNNNNNVGSSSLKDPGDPDGGALPPEKLSLGEQVKFYVSLSLGIIASLCVFALLFLIPLVVEPSISTLLADFDPSAATCVTVDYTSATGLSKCGLWASCREGCTSTPSQCHQIYVSYRKADRPGWKIENFTILDAHDWLDESRWDVSYTQLLINAKGCGYPPRVKCDEFGETYGFQGRTFPCFYSRANPRLVVTDYNWEETAQPLLLALGLPTGLFAISISILSFWYCPSCEERGKNKRPCRARYQSARASDSEFPAADSSKQSSNNSKSTTSTKKSGGPAPPEESNKTLPIPIVQQPRGKSVVAASNYQPRSPSLATISSRDTTVSSVNSLDDGWQSPPSPPPRMNSRMNASKSNLKTRARKL